MSTDQFPSTSSSSSHGDASALPGDTPPAPRASSPPASPLLAPGSHDDSFLLSPHCHRVGPDIGDSEYQLPTAPPTSPGSAADALFAAINVNLAPPAAPAATTPGLAPERRDGADDDEEDDDAPPARASWPMVILGSYSSAVTLALIWVLLHPRTREPEPVPFAPAVAPIADAQPARDAEPRGHRVEPVAPLPADRIARLGETLRVGALEITPVDVARRDITLRRVGVAGAAVERKGLPGTIVLRVRLRNASDDQSFAPLDPSFVRQRGSEVPPTFAEAPGGNRLYPYPLAFESEMGIVGQDFRELRPGETRDLVIVTAPASPADANPAGLTWRLRFRTGVDQTESVGVSPAKPG